VSERPMMVKSGISGLVRTYESRLSSLVNKISISG
jgi:hypothetical protein